MLILSIFKLKNKTLSTVKKFSKIVGNKLEEVKKTDEKDKTKKAENNTDNFELSIVQAVLKGERAIL